MAGGVPMNTAPIEGGYLKGKQLIFPLSLVISLFFLWVRFCRTLVANKITHSIKGLLLWIARCAQQAFPSRA